MSANDQRCRASEAGTLSMQSLVLFVVKQCVFPPYLLIIYSVQPAAYIDKCFQH